MTGSIPQLSIVIPFYNAERYLERCIAALRSQTVPRECYEIILVDNNSSDNSVALLQGQPDLILLSQPVPGSYAARNMGIRAARADIIATIDPDCTADEHWVGRILEGMTDPDCLVLLGQQRHASTSQALWLLELYEAEKIAYVADQKEKEQYYGYTNNMAFRTSVFDTLGLFPERMRGGDTIFIRRVVDSFGCNGVRFNPLMKTTHLEVDTVFAYYNKRVIYGKSNERLSLVTPFRSLNTRQRWKVFQNVVRKHGISFRHTLFLLALLAPGALLYEAGKRSGKLAGAGQGEPKA